MKKNELEKFISSKLYSKYKIDNTIYALNIIDNIIFNERTHLVSTFKDYLILDDEFEFIKRYYNHDESIKRLKTFLNFYSKNKKQFPNYSNLKEADFILKNIESKREMVKNFQNSPKQKRKTENIFFNSKESLSNTIFNSKVYESIINDSENGLSIFYDKESLYNKNNIDSTNKKDDDINKLIDHFEEIGNDITYSFGNKNEKISKQDNSLIKDFDLEPFNENNKLTKIQNYQKIYKKKKTPCNSINRRKNIIYNTTKVQKKNYINNNENMDYINYKNLVLYSENNHNIIGIKLNKNNQNTSPNPQRKIQNSSIPYLNTYTDIYDRNETIRTPNNNNNKRNVMKALRSNHYKLNSDDNINENLLKNNLLTERIHPIIKVKINMKKNEKKIIKRQTKINTINKNILKNSEKEKTNIKKPDNNKNFYLKQKVTLDNIGMTYNYNKKNLINHNSINNNFNNGNGNIPIKSVENLNKHRSNSINTIKENKINLVKKNKEKENMLSNYAINKYKNKLSNYNNYTSIQFNNNNINIINSNSNNANHNAKNICYNTYGNFFQKSDDGNFLNNLSNIGHKSQEFGKRRKKLNKKCTTYFFSNNNEKLDQKLKFKNKLKFLENLNIMNNRINTNFNSIDSLSQRQRGLNSARVSTPLTSKQNKKIFLKIYKKVNLSNNKDEKNHSIMNDTYKKYKIRFLDNKIIKHVNNSSITDNFDKFNLTLMNQFNKTSSNMNSINFNNSNMNTLNSSLYKKKRRKHESQIIYYINKDNNDILNNNFVTNNKEDEKNFNNFGRIIKRKKIKKNNELLEIKKLDEKKKMIINQFNQQMNQIKMKFIKEIENKFEISKRNIINKGKIKNKLITNPAFSKYK